MAPGCPHLEPRLGSEDRDGWPRGPRSGEEREAGEGERQGRAGVTARAQQVRGEHRLDLASTEFWSSGPATYLPIKSDSPAFTVDLAPGCFSHKLMKLSCPACHAELPGLAGKVTPGEMPAKSPFRCCGASRTHNAALSVVTLQ